jgi:hypothetical protein
VARTGETVGKPVTGELARELLDSPDIVGAYKVAEVVTLTRDGSPVCWPIFPHLERDRIAFSTGYVYPGKARNAQRDPKMAVLFSDPTASGRSDADPFVLVQGRAEVFDEDLQRNTERYVDLIIEKGQRLLALSMRVPQLRQLMVGYLARIWIELIPERTYVWGREERVPVPVRHASIPGSFSAKPGITLGEEVSGWVSRYRRPPVLSYIDATGWPAMTRVRATVARDHIVLSGEIETREGAPAGLTFHRQSNNWVLPSNDAFLIRGHFDARGNLVPERCVGYGGTKDDHGVGSLKVMRMLLVDFRRQLSEKLEKEGRPTPVVRPTPRR